MTRKLLQKPSQEVLQSHTPSTTTTSTTAADDNMVHTHRMGSVLEERRDPNFNTWTEIIPERVREAAKGYVRSKTQTLGMRR